MAEYLEDIAVGGEVVTYPDGSWEQYFSDGSVVQGNQVDPRPIYIDPEGVAYETTADLVQAPPAPEYRLDPGLIVKKGEYFYRYTEAKDSAGLSVWRGVAVTAAQAADAKLAQQQQTGSKILIPALVVGAGLLLFGGK